jgi:hypothetical protein
MPGFCQASVFINEVAWMGSELSANHEWIELHNDGPSVSVTGWTLTDGRNLAIELSGTISGNSYAVLERTSDETVSGTAFMIYTGALSNTGGVLRLENSGGQLVDLVNGDNAWEQIGGDNVTKETAQYTSKGWITAAATPGSKNESVASVNVVEVEENLENDAEDKESKKKVETVRLVLPQVSLNLNIDAQSVGYVNQAIPFLSGASGIGKVLSNSLQYQWNFGDGNISSRSTSSHSFQFPGTYIVTLQAEYKRQKQVTRHEITILPVALSLTLNTDGDVQLNNNSPYEIDISGYKIKASDTFVFPEYSIILPNQTITLPQAKVAHNNNLMVAVYDTAGLSLASIFPKALLFYDESSATPRLAKTTSPEDVSHSYELLTSQNSFSKPAVVSPSSNSQESLVPDDDPEIIYATATAAVSTEMIPHVINRSERFSYVGLMIIILLGILGVYLVPKRNEID